MRRKFVLLVFLVVMFVSLLTVVLTIQFAKSDWAWTETIYIKADGSIQPALAPLSTTDNITYTLTDNIVGDVPDYATAVVVQRDHIVIDGGGYTLRGIGGGGTCIGIDLTGRSNITITNLTIETFFSGIWLNMSAHTINLSRNTIVNCFAYGIFLHDSPDNTITGNNITSDNGVGIWLWGYSNHNNVSKNNIAGNSTAIRLVYWSSHNIISENNITNCKAGLALSGSSDNMIFRNNITNSSIHAIMVDAQSNNNSILENNIMNNYCGIRLGVFSTNNSISENTIVNNDCGIETSLSTGNMIYHNNFTSNEEQVNISWSGYPNFWDDGVGEGNYWSDYLDKHPNATRLNGIWDTPYFLDEYNQDNYPIVPEFSTLITPLLFMIVALLATIIYKRRRFPQIN